MAATPKTDDQTKEENVGFVYPTGTTVADQLVTFMDVDAISRASTWAEKELKIENKDSLWFERLGETYAGFEFLDDAIAAFLHAKSLPDAHWKASIALAVVYGMKGEREMAIKAIDPVIEDLRARCKSASAPEKDQADLLRSLRLQAAWHFKTEPPNVDTAAALYREVLEISPDDYDSQWKLFTVLVNAAHLSDALELLRALSARPAHKIGEVDQLTEMLFNFKLDDLDSIVGIETFDLVVSVTAGDSLSTQILKNLKLCIDIASKEDNTASLLRLLLLQGVALFESNVDSLDQREAIVSWKECCSVGFKKLADLESDSEMRSAVTLATKRIAYYHYGLARKGEDGHQHITALQEFYLEAQKTYWTAQPVRSALAAYYASSNSLEKARDLLLNDMKTALDLLSDDDPENDYQGYGYMAETTLRAGDDLNALSAWSLQVPDDVDGDESSDDQAGNATAVGEDQDENGKAEPGVDDDKHANDGNEDGHAENPPATSSESSPPSPNEAVAPEADSVLPKIVVPVTNGISPTPKVRTGKLGNFCDGGCGTVWRYADDLYSCKICADVQFDLRCLNKLRAGTLKRVVCSPEHEWLHVPPFSDEEYHKVGKGNVRMGGTLVDGARQGGEIVPIAVWLDALRDQWGIPREVKDETKDETAEKAT